MTTNLTRIAHIGLGFAGACSGSDESRQTREPAAPSPAHERGNESGQRGGPGSEVASNEGAQALSQALRALEAHLTAGETYGAGPDAAVIAAAAARPWRRETASP